MSLENTIRNHERAFDQSPTTKARFDTARQVAGIGRDTASAPFSGQGHLSGVEAVANSTTAPANRDTPPAPAPGSQSEAVERNTAGWAEADRRAINRNRE